MVNGISSIGFGSQQTCLQKTKSLGFGVGGTMNDTDLKRCHVEPEGGWPRDNGEVTPKDRFEAQVLANQQKMLGLLGEIKKNTAPKNSYEGISNIR